MSDDTSELLSNDSYIREHGATVCPSCKNDNITVEKMEVEHVTAFQPCKCKSCGFKWEDMWELTKYVKVEN